jgi:hypothetical protein
MKKKYRPNDSTYEREELMRPTTDDWCPNYPNDEVKVRCTLNMEHQGKIWHRVSVWGADDLGMERDFHGTDEKDLAVELYRTVVRNPPVTFAKLKLLNFVNA